ncbi:MAG: polyisoprenoid-binding protein YceI [Bradymonadia bacterium]|jgi:polyisoprenoid-binding protein YceI
MKRLTPLLVLALLAAPSAVSAADFVIAPGLSSVSFESDATLETITGTSAAIHGTLTTDINAPGTTSGTISVPVASLRTGVDLRDEHLHSADWLNAAGHPEITFALTSVDVPSGATLSHGQAINATVTGDFSLNGVTRSVTTTAEVSFYEIANDQVAGSYGIDNDILRIEARFAVPLGEHNITVHPPLRLKVAESIEVSVNVSAVLSE